MIISKYSNRIEQTKRSFKMSWFHDLPYQTSRYPQGSIFFKMYLFKFFVLPLFTDLQGLHTTHCVLNYIFPKNQVILIYVQFVEGQANIQ